MKAGDKFISSANDPGLGSNLGKCFDRVRQSSMYLLKYMELKHVQMPNQLLRIYLVEVHRKQYFNINIVGGIAFVLVPVYMLESASETAARRMVEDLFKQEADAAEPLGDFVLIDHNEINHRKHKKQEESEITVCECVIEDDNPESACGDQCLNMMTCTECTPGYCPSDELCRNQRFQRCQYAQTKLVQTDNRGWGLAACQDLKAGDFVMEYCGEVVPVKEALQRAKVYETSGTTNWFILNLNGGEYIDVTHVGSLARFINHSCDPNCETTKWTVLGEERIGIFAIQDISAGTELTFDYKYTWFGGARMRCACGANSCSGSFGGKSKAFQVFMRDGVPFGKDAYAWEDDAQRTDAEEGGRQSDAEDDAPLSSFIDPSLVGRKVRSGMIVNPKNAGVIIKTSAEKSAPEAVVKKEGQPTSVTTEAPATSVAGPSYTPAEKSTPVRRRASVFKKDKLSSFKGVHVLGGKFKDSSEPRMKKSGKGMQRVAAPAAEKSEEPEEKPEEQEIHSRKRSRSDVEDQLKAAEVILSTEQYMAQNVQGVAGFQNARSVVNKLLLAEFPNFFPVSEAACAEVEFAQELEMAAVSDLKKVCDELQPVLRTCCGPDGSTWDDNPVPSSAGENWMVARCKQLRGSLNFHFSIIRHLAGPTFALCSTKEAPLVPT
ncbi:hypothetical protein Mapa_010832 [Marchantia paleacea]|nr:hypothetical protein Mapa_010832 [Marchantia paleacea]